MNDPQGLLVIDKPAGWTSHDVVARVRRLVGTRRVGHAGTLDPMATGVLVLGVGRGTKLLTFLVGCDKTYAATVRLGQATSTDDAEGEILSTADPSAISEQDLAAAVGDLTGSIRQVPSSVSAVKVDGRRAYARVRAGEAVELPAREVTVHRFDIRARRPARTADGHPVLDVDVHVEVSSGTYVRALARDLGAALGVGGHLTALRRTRVGRFDVAEAHSLEALADTEPGGIPLLPLAQAARAQFRVHELTEAQARALGFGQRIDSDEPPTTAPVAAIGPDDTLVAMLDESGPRARTHVVFAAAGS
ncbi:MAG: tRNA pseudouridine(55) synthase TruB [Dermatophilaceae bacterium]